MKQTLKHILSTLIMLLTVFSTVTAQRRVTPIDNPDLKRTDTEVKTSLIEELAKKPESVIESVDVEGNVVFIDTISGKEWHDTTKVDKKIKLHPKLHAITVGADLFDAAMMAFGKGYGGVGFWGELSLWNWLKPIVEIGIATADYTPDGNNFTYKSGVAPYMRIGLNYNFLYNSNPDYSVYVGLRYGITNFKYEISNATSDQNYWGDVNQFSIPSQSATIGYGELLVGLRVMIAKGISLGWALKYHAILNQPSSPEYGKPWFIPGYGTQGSTFGIAFSIAYTLPLSEPIEPKASDTNR